MAPGKGSARGAAAVFDLFASCPCSGAACLQLFRWGSVPSSSDCRAFDRRILNLYGSTWIRRVFRVAALSGPSLLSLRSLHVLASNPAPLARGLVWPAAPSDGRMFRQRDEKTGFQDKSAARGWGLRRQEGGGRRGRGEVKSEGMEDGRRGRDSGADGSECSDTEERRKRRQV